MTAAHRLHLVPKAEPKARPYVFPYHEGMSCPGCGRGAWLHGRVSVECAKCGFAMDLGEK